MPGRKRPIPVSSSRILPVADTDSLPDPLPNLVAALESTLNLVSCGAVADLCALLPARGADAAPAGPSPATAADAPPKRGAGYVVNRPIRIGNHYDLQPAITIYDPDLGTLAFVEHISRATGTAETAAWDAIERATAVRQILIDEAAR